MFSFNLNDFFVSDDFDWLYLTKTSPSNPLTYFGSNYFGQIGQGGSYRPMVNLIFWLNWQIGGLNPIPYHLTNLLFHIGVCFLLYLLALRLFEQSDKKQKIAILAAVFFSLLPNHSEAVIWIAAVADPMASFFYLLAFYLYLIWRQQKKKICFIISLLSFIIALLTKELAITLPVIIFIWEFYEAIDKKKFRWQDIILKPLTYWLLLIGYFIVRFLTIGLTFGYYAETRFRLDLAKIFKMFVSLTTDLFFYGKLRVALTDFFMANKLLYGLIFFIIVGLIIYSLREYKFKAALLIDSYLFLILPVLLLAYNYFNDEGERYNYLPSVMFCILLSLLVWQIKKDKVKKIILLFGLLFYFAILLINKNYTWQLASQITKKTILTDLPQIVDLQKSDQHLLFIGLPDNLDGAQVWRNAITLAIKLYYPSYRFTGLNLNAYVRLTKKIADAKVLYWGPYPTGGWIAKTFDQKNWVTGLATEYTDNYTYELWGYNYQNYTSDTIRLILKGVYAQAFADNKLQILTYDMGKLVNLK
jgi:hypothetical protein